MPTVDNLGVWKDLGTVNPVVNDWQFFPYFAETEHSTFKLFFQGDIEILQNWKVSAYIRAVYFSGSQYFADENWIRVYPKHDPEIISYPYPADMVKDPLPPRQFQCRRKLRYNNEPFRKASPILGLQLQEKADTNVIYPGDPYPVEETTTP